MLTTAMAAFIGSALLLTHGVLVRVGAYRRPARLLDPGVMFVLAPLFVVVFLCVAVIYFDNAE